MARFMASSRSPNMDQVGPSYTPSDPLPGTFLGLALDIRSEKLYDHVNIGFHEILLHDVGEEELPFVATSELDGTVAKGVQRTFRLHAIWEL